MLQEGIGRQPFSCRSLHVSNKSSSRQKYTEENHNGRNHDGTKYGGHNNDELNPTYHCCNSGNNN